jgi:low affinity Fe/Cu permease
MNDWFRKFASKISEIVGSPWAFLIALLLTIAWAVSGPFFGFSDTWQLVINTASTISTGLIVFLIQNTQNRDAKAIHLKLDELLRAVKDARTGMVDLEDMSDEELKRLQEEFKDLREHQGGDIQHVPELIEDELEERENESAAKHT